VCSGRKNSLIELGAPEALNQRSCTRQSRKSMKPKRTSACRCQPAVNSHHSDGSGKGFDSRKILITASRRRPRLRTWAREPELKKAVHGCVRFERGGGKKVICATRSANYYRAVESHRAGGERNWTWWQNRLVVEGNTVDGTTGGASKGNDANQQLLEMRHRGAKNGRWQGRTRSSLDFGVTSTWTREQGPARRKRGCVGGSFFPA